MSLICSISKNQFCNEKAEQHFINGKGLRGIDPVTWIEVDDDDDDDDDDNGGYDYAPAA